MIAPRAHRRLAAILAADVAGYSRLMGADEAGTLAVLREVWAGTFNPLVASHEGRIVKMMGDGALVEFASAVDAVEAAVAIQSAMAARDGAGGPVIAFRIGVNLGDIVIEGDDIFGDGVNVAARLEAQAPTGGILVSDAVHAQVRGKVGVAFADAGPMALKNIVEPVRAWAWGGEAAAGLVPPRDTPSIAVLPFENMSGDPEQDYFSDGISEDIITDLSKIAGLMVVARNSSFAYKGRSADIRVVGRELGVSSVLEGSIRRAGNRVRITAQLIDTGTGGHLWADRFDRELTDIFAVQDEVTLEIVAALRVKLRPVERALFDGIRSVNVEAHDCLLRARELSAEVLRSAEGGRENIGRIVTLLGRAISLDPSYAPPYAFLGMAYSIEYHNRWTDIPDPLALAVHFAEMSVTLGPDEAACQNAAAITRMLTGDLDGARVAAERSVALNPNFSGGYATLGHLQVYLGQPRAAVPILERAIRLDPVFAHQYIHFLGLAYLVAGDPEAAVAKLRERIRLAPRTDASRVFLASALGQLGEVDEARRVWADLMEVNPRYSLDAHLGRLPFSDHDAALVRNGLAEAGLPV
jgi:adenylate cyclase